ncbi:piggyBac transposable element-derived 4-like protein [Labeo rohita]|uniref:PiggyBac transposable element-derived 4-like protein n=1 Tax=Labeo rohita TaxID=84645 RepID=A0A498NGR8_LABRO|nr:piggyBac transposable element-derived 4-like protein [Labeo rohita]
MPRRARKEAAQTNLDSEEECSLSSEEEGEYDDERLHFEERFDPAEDAIADEKVVPSRAPHTRTAHKHPSAFSAVENLKDENEGLMKDTDYKILTTWMLCKQEAGRGGLAGAKNGSLWNTTRDGHRG